jgi:hypothetical protein
VNSSTEALTQIVAQAIDRSVTHGEIVFISEPLCLEELLRECEGEVYVANIDEYSSNVHEFWGIDLDGEEWRVHVYC